MTPTNPSFSEALGRFVSARKSGKKAMDGHQELGRFIAWCGRDRKVDELTPAEVAEYAQNVGMGRADSPQRLNSVKVFLGFLKDEGWVETGLAAHLRIPRSRRSLASRRNSAAQLRSTQLSREGYERLQVQLEALKDERVKVVEDIKRAMEDKDFRENAPLDAAKERQGFIESKIRELESSLTGAQILEEGALGPQARVTIGAKVTLKDVASGRQLLYTLVDVREADVSSGKISVSSPVGQALMDKTTGEELSINVPRGTLNYVIEKIGS